MYSGESCSKTWALRGAIARLIASDQRLSQRPGIRRKGAGDLPVQQQTATYPASRRPRRTPPQDPTKTHCIRTEAHSDESKAKFMASKRTEKA